MEGVPLQSSDSNQSMKELGQPKTGFNMKSDFKAAINNPALSDITFSCSDGITMHASRLTLAMRSDTLQSMLCGQMDQAGSNIMLSEITAVQLTAVLEYCYTEETPSLSLDNAVEVFEAAKFFRLPLLRDIVINHVKTKLSDSDYTAAGKLFSQAATIWAIDHELFSFIRRFFLTKTLAVGDLTSLSREALRILLADINVTKDCKTNTFDLFKCVIDWAFRAIDRPPTDVDRLALLGYLNSAHNLHQGNSQVAKKKVLPDQTVEEIGVVLIPFIPSIRFGALCQHQLAAVMETLSFIPVNIFADAFREHISANHDCVKRKFEWILIDNGFPTYVELSANKSFIRCTHSIAEIEGLKVFHISASALPSTGIVEWEVVVRFTFHDTFHNNPNLVSVGLTTSIPQNDLPLDSIDISNNRILGMNSSEWSVSASGDVWESGFRSMTIPKLTEGTVLTFRLNMTEHICTVLINYINYDIVWSNLPAQLQPAISLIDRSSCEIR